MNFPVCEKGARAHIYYCVRCAVYVHEKYWPKHVTTAHKEEK